MDTQTENINEEIGNLQNIVQQKSEEISELQNKILRIAAEFDNFKKRSERDHKTLIKFGNESILQELLPVIDNLGQAILMASHSQQNDSIITGIKMVLRQFEEILNSHGLNSFPSLGEQFNPIKHEAVDEQINADVPDGQIIQELQKGYFLCNRLVRPARVIVAKQP